MFKSSYWSFGLLSYWSSFFIILSIIESGVLKSSIVVEPSISPFKSVNVYFMYLGALMFDTYVYNHYIFLVK